MDSLSISIRMAIVRSGGRAEMMGPGGAKAPAKAAKGALKHAAKKHAEKHAAKKHAAKKHAEKHPAKKHAAEKHVAKKSAKRAAHRMVLGGGLRGDGLAEADEALLTEAFHHLHRAGAVISLLEAETGGDLRSLLEHGIALYRNVQGGKQRTSVQCAAGLLRAAEHLAMAGLYGARKEHRAVVGAPSQAEVGRHLEELEERLGKVAPGKRGDGERLQRMARELLRRAEAAGDDPHLEYELRMAADGICSALEGGL